MRIKKYYYSFKFTIISKFYILENKKMLLFINNFFNIKKKKLIKKLVKQKMLIVKFYILENEKNVIIHSNSS